MSLKVKSECCNRWRFPIWSLLSPASYLQPFSRYSSLKYVSWPLPFKVTQGQIWILQSIAGRRFPIRLLLSPTSYMLPFSRYSTSKICDLDLWPLRVIWGQMWKSHSKAHMRFPIWPQLSPASYLQPFSGYLTSKYCDLDLWPPQGHPRSNVKVAIERP